MIFVLVGVVVSGKAQSLTRRVGENGATEDEASRQRYQCLRPKTLDVYKQWTTAPRVALVLHWPRCRATWSLRAGSRSTASAV